MVRLYIPLGRILNYQGPSLTNRRVRTDKNLKVLKDLLLFKMSMVKNSKSVEKSCDILVVYV
jgi:hypothetical protein